MGKAQRHLAMKIVMAKATQQKSTALAKQRKGSHRKMMNGSYKKIKVRFIGEDDPLAVLHGKVYDAFIGQKGMICVVDETGDEYAYPSSLFEIIDQ